MKGLERSGAGETEQPALLLVSLGLEGFSLAVSAESPVLLLEA